VEVSAATLLLIASTMTATDRAIKTALVYDGAAFDDLASGLHRGTTFRSTIC